MSGHPLFDDSEWGPLDALDAPDPKLVPTWLFLRESPRDPRPNDGVTPAESARGGTFLGRIAAVHLDEVERSPDFSGESATPFDHLCCYRDLLVRLRALEETGDMRPLLAWRP